MKNNRSLNDHQELIKKHQLSTDSPAEDSLFWQMWRAGSDIAEKALNSDFIQGIKAGDLDPIQYGAFNLSDIYYCFKSAADYKVAADKAEHPVFKDYLLKKQQSYDKYNQSSLQTWSLNGPESVRPIEITKKYSEFEGSVARGSSNLGDVEDPIYTLIVQLPCEYLWAWLAQQLVNYTDNNIHADWITSNDYPQGGYAMGNFLQDYLSQHPFDTDLATKVYLQAMEFEYQNFVAATAKKRD